MPTCLSWLLLIVGAGSPLQLRIGVGVPGWRTCRCRQCSDVLSRPHSCWGVLPDGQAERDARVRYADFESIAG
jgi:hypothetical protein